MNAPVTHGIKPADTVTDCAIYKQNFNGTMALTTSRNI